MYSNSRFIILALLSNILWIQTSHAQHKFELGLYVDPFIIPVNSATFIEDGPGYYDIHGSIKVAQGMGAVFNYWPFKSFGISVGAALRNFESNIDYAFPDPYYPEAGPLIEASYPYKAKGWGPTVALHWRNNRWQANIGIGIFDITHAEYESISGVTGVSIWDEFGEKILDINVEEEAYWLYAPYEFEFLQFEAQYYFSKNFFVRFGFENSGKSYWYPVTILVSGFIKDVIPQEQVLNDYKMKAQQISFTLGVGGNLGFGKYKSHK
jgi:hypothetical protein